MTMSLVQTVTVGPAGAASIEFTGIPQTGQDLVVVYSVRTSYAIDYGFGVGLQVNGSATGYAARRLDGNGATATSATGPLASNIRVQGNPGTTATANTFTNASIYLPNYTNALSKSLSVDAVAENNATNTDLNIVAGSWSGTASITSFKIYDYGSGFVQHSTASLYTISTTGATGATVA